MDFLEKNKNKKLLMDGITLLEKLRDESVDVAVFDPQYRDIMEAMKYGNEGERQKGRAKLPQMSELTIINFLWNIQRVLKPSSYLFLWVDKFILCEGNHKAWFEAITKNIVKPDMYLVDMITWNKELMGMGRRSRRVSEHLLIYQKRPKTIKSWTDKGIPDVWEEKISNPRNKDLHPHRKPVGLMKRLLESVTEKDDFVVDPCAGSFSTLSVADNIGRNFIGCDISNKFGEEKPIS